MIERKLKSNTMICHLRQGHRTYIVRPFTYEWKVEMKNRIRLLSTVSRRKSDATIIYTTRDFRNSFVRVVQVRLSRKIAGAGEMPNHGAGIRLNYA